jgi:DNA-binding transcriptional MerR regulator
MSLSGSSLDVARIAGVTLQQLQWWDERSVISPRIEDHKRLYTEDQVLEIVLIAALRRKGLSPQKIRTMARQLRKLAISRRFILVDTVTGAVHTAADPEEVCDLLDRATTPMVLVRVPEL